MSSVDQERNKQPLCPACNRPFQSGKQKCMWCGADLSKVALPQVELACPCCSEQKLAEHLQREWRIHMCPSCGGAFLSSIMMEKLEEFYAEAPAEPGAKPATRLQETEIAPEGETKLYRRCPQCGEQMARRRYRRISDVVVDECLSHGYWLDPMELQRIVTFLKSGGLKKSASYESKEKQRRDESAREIQRIINKSATHHGRLGF